MDIQDLKSRMNLDEEKISIALERLRKDLETNMIEDGVKYIISHIDVVRYFIKRVEETMFVLIDVFDFMSPSEDVTRVELFDKDGSLNPDVKVDLIKYSYYSLKEYHNFISAIEEGRFDNCTELFDKGRKLIRKIIRKLERGEEIERELAEFEYIRVSCGRDEYIVSHPLLRDPEFWEELDGVLYERWKKLQLG